MKMQHQTMTIEQLAFPILAIETVGIAGVDDRTPVNARLVSNRHDRGVAAGSRL